VASVLPSKRWSTVSVTVAVVALTLGACARSDVDLGRTGGPSDGTTPADGFRSAGPATGASTASAPALGATGTSPPSKGGATSTPGEATSDAAWVAATCSALGAWLADADRDEDSLRGLAQGGDTQPAALRRKALAVVDASTARTADLRMRLAAVGLAAQPDLIVLAAETDRVLAETVQVLEGVRPRIAALPVEDRRLFATAAGPVVGEVLLGEARLVGELASAVVAARESGAGRLLARTPQCRSLDRGLRLAPG
jgi:hypothetical protein